MKELNNKIRNDIAKSYRLRELAKDGRITQQKSIELGKLASENDQKILFYKKLANALEEIKKEEKIQHSQK